MKYLNKLACLSLMPILLLASCRGSELKNEKQVDVVEYSTKLAAAVTKNTYSRASEKGYMITSTNGKSITTNYDCQMILDKATGIWSPEKESSDYYAINNGVTVTAFVVAIAKGFGLDQSIQYYIGDDGFKFTVYGSNEFTILDEKQTVSINAKYIFNEFGFPVYESLKTYTKTSSQTVEETIDLSISYYNI